MRHLQGIIEDNERAAARKPEDNFSRECSFCGDVENGVVIHSARHRNTRFLKPGVRSRNFLAKWFGTNSQERRNEIVESYFV